MISATVSEKDSFLSRIQWEADGGVRLNLLGFVSFPNGYRGDIHSHPFWELIFIGQGRGYLHRGDRVQACGSDQILLLRPGEKHQFRAGDSDPFDQLYLGFSYDFAMPVSVPPFTPEVLPPGPFTDLIRAELRDSLNSLRQNGGETSLEAVRARLLSVVSRVVGFFIAPGNKKAAPPRQNQDMVRTAKEFLQANLKAKLAVPELARQFCLSPQYFGEIFKRETGVSIKEYQRTCRLSKAMEMLRESGLSITEISETIGLDDLAYFSRIFKKQFGMPPRQVRAALD